MKPLFFSILIIALISCDRTKKRDVINRLPVNKTEINYDSCKKAIVLIKNKNKAGWNKLSIKQKEKLFSKAVVETIIPGWIGTPWSFNGTTEKPRQGAIACGYFVTTVLRDAGLDLARIKLSQCASETMILALIQAQYVQHFRNTSMDNFIQSIQRQGYGLYIVGLDNHTGFIYNDGEEIYFIHSSYVGTRAVQKDKAATNWILQQSKYKVLGKISADEKVLDRWMR
jgi:hypothetical protein